MKKDNFTKENISKINRERYSSDARANNTQMVNEDHIIEKPFTNKVDIRRFNYVMSVNRISNTVRFFLTISWICAALSAFISPIFVFGGVISGYMASRRIKGIGRAAILTNIILAIINLILTTLFLYSLGNLFVMLQR